MPKALKRTLQVIGAIVAFVLVVVLAYAIYITASYNRIDDHQALEVENATAVEGNTPLKCGDEYTALTYNIGFGAYSPDYTFFMDEGIMADGTKTVGSSGKAKSQQTAEANTQGTIQVAREHEADFMLFQEVDTNSDRSFHINQKQQLEDAFADKAGVFAVNFHSVFLPLPITDMHGVVNAGMLTLSDMQVASAERRSYPVSDAWPTKFFDLDRCFMVTRFAVEDGHELVLVNSHMSAYDEGGTIRAQQLAMLSGVLEEEAAKGNYVIVGGDWNHALCGSVDMYESQQQIPEWVSTLDDADLPQGFSIVRADNIEEVATCRGADIPYEKGVTYRTTVDGFIVSSNVKARAQNIETEYAYSDHNPVRLTFTLGQ